MTCYQPGSSKTLSKRGCTGFTLFPKNDNGLQCLVKAAVTCYQPGRSKTLSGGVVMGFTFSLKMVPRYWYQDPGTKILVPRSWYQDLVPRSWHGQAWHGTEIFGTARIIRAQHGNIWHGTDPPDPGTARHGTGFRVPAVSFNSGQTARAVFWP